MQGATRKLAADREEAFKTAVMALGEQRDILLVRYWQINLMFTLLPESCLPFATALHCSIESTNTETGDEIIQLLVRRTEK
ncbi:MAG: hypothetical protein V3U75_08410 [Methylococcaceae bacterium]